MTVVVVAGSEAEVIDFANRFKDKVNDKRNWWPLMDVREFERINDADVIYTGSYMARPDIRLIVKRVEFMIKAGLVTQHLVPFNFEKKEVVL
jgi:hypothetical protein